MTTWYGRIWVRYTRLSSLSHSRALCHSCDEHMTNEHMTFLKRARERTGRSRRRFGGWKFSPPFQRWVLSQKMGQMSKKTPKIEYTFSSCISNLSKKEYTTFLQNFQFDFVVVAFGSVRLSSKIIALHKMASTLIKKPKTEYVLSSCIYKLSKRTVYNLFLYPFRLSESLSH